MARVKRVRARPQTPPSAPLPPRQTRASRPARSADLLPAEGMLPSPAEDTQCGGFVSSSAELRGERFSRRGALAPAGAAEGTDPPTPPPPPVGCLPLAAPAGGVAAAGPRGSAAPAAGPRAVAKVAIAPAPRLGGAARRLRAGGGTAAGSGSCASPQPQRLQRWCGGSAGVPRFSAHQAPQTPRDGETGASNEFQQTAVREGVFQRSAIFNIDHTKDVISEGGVGRAAGDAIRENR